LSVILMRGKAGAGKTFRARRICAETGAQLLSVDELTAAVFGTECVGREQHLAREERVLSYFLTLAFRNSQSGRDTVIDHGFWRKKELLQAEEFFKKENIPFEVVTAEADFETRLKRISERKDGRSINEAKLRMFDGWYEE